MAQITAAMVKQLREMTDSPMMECKKALVEADGDMDVAVDVLRKNGLAKAAKKAGRETNEGAVAAFVSEDGKSGALLELSCETDFVGSNAKFTGFASKVAEVVATTEPADVDALLEKPMGEETVSSELHRDDSHHGREHEDRSFLRSQGRERRSRFLHPHGW